MWSPNTDPPKLAASTVAITVDSGFETCATGIEECPEPVPSGASFVALDRTNIPSSRSIQDDRPLDWISRHTIKLNESSYL